MDSFEHCMLRFNVSDASNVSQNGVGNHRNWSHCSAVLDLLLSGRHGDLAQYTRDLITYYVTGVAGLTVSCLGLVGNTLSIIVLTRKAMQSSTYTYLSALAVCDTAFLLCFILLTTKDLKKPQPDMETDMMWDVGGLYPYLFQYVHPAAYTLQVTSIWLTLAFTVDRYIVICHPFQSERYCTISRARKVVLMLYVVSIVFNLPKFFEYRTVRIVHPMLRTVRVSCDLTQFGRTRLFRQLYHSWLYLVFVCGLPFAALAVLNSFLIRAVRLSSRRAREMSAIQRRRIDTTVMLISVVVVFFSCQTPALISRVIWAFVDEPQQVFKGIALYTLNEVGSLLVVVNSSVNFVPYYLFGRRFRRQLLRIVQECRLHGRWPRRPNSYSPSQPIYSFTLTASKRRLTQEAVEYRKESVCFGGRRSSVD